MAKCPEVSDCAKMHEKEKKSGQQEHSYLYNFNEFIYLFIFAWHDYPDQK